MTTAGYIALGLVIVAGAVYLCLRKRYKQDKPKDLYHSAKEDLKK